MPLFRRRRPLMRAAAVGGAGYLAGKHVAEGEQGPAQPAEQPAAAVDSQPVAPAHTGISTDGVERLKELGELHEQGVLTDSEFSDEKAKVLGS